MGSFSRQTSPLANGYLCHLWGCDVLSTATNGLADSLKVYVDAQELLTTADGTAWPHVSPMRYCFARGAGAHMPLQQAAQEAYSRAN